MDPTSSDEQETCFICFDRVDSKDFPNVFSPCKCRTLVHRGCFNAHQEYRTDNITRCEVCHGDYQYDAINMSDIALPEYGQLFPEVVPLIAVEPIVVDTMSRIRSRCTCVNAAILIFATIVIASFCKWIISGFD
jgi:E3 ubiquitin-protein ligase DOA10